MSWLTSTIPNKDDAPVLKEITNVTAEKSFLTPSFLLLQYKF
jgi:hypothetical protein